MRLVKLAVRGPYRISKKKNNNRKGVECMHVIDENLCCVRLRSTSSKLDSLELLFVSFSAVANVIIIQLPIILWPSLRIRHPFVTASSKRKSWETSRPYVVSTPLGVKDELRFLSEPGPRSADYYFTHSTHIHKLCLFLLLLFRLLLSVLYARRKSYGTVSIIYWS